MRDRDVTAGVVDDVQVSPSIEYRRRRDREALIRFDRVAGGLADSALLQRFYPRMVRREFAPQGYVRQLLKDLEMVHEFAAASKSPTPMTAQALSLYRMLAHLGHTELDTTALIKLYDPR